MNSALPLRAPLGVRERIAVALAALFNATCFLLLPAMPLIVSVMVWDSMYLRRYGFYFLKFIAHFKALREGPVRHYLADVFMQVREVPATIEGHCVQCGNCCLDKRCAFLQPLGDDKYACGIFHSTVRRFSNCGSFPLHARDIERYQCPSYFVAPPAAQPVRWLPKRLPAQSPPAPGQTPPPSIQ
jgi:hypothetical protein